MCIRIPTSWRALRVSPISTYLNAKFIAVHDDQHATHNNLPKKLISSTICVPWLTSPPPDGCCRSTDLRTGFRRYFLFYMMSRHASTDNKVTRLIILSQHFVSHSHRHSGTVVVAESTLIGKWEILRAICKSNFLTAGTYSPRIKMFLVSWRRLKLVRKQGTLVRNTIVPGGVWNVYFAIWNSLTSDIQNDNHTKHLTCLSESNNVSVWVIESHYNCLSKYCCRIWFSARYALLVKKRFLGAFALEKDLWALSCLSVRVYLRTA